jgi:hypothetical protein
MANPSSVPGTTFEKPPLPTAPRPELPPTRPLQRAATVIDWIGRALTLKEVGLLVFPLLCALPAAVLGVLGWVDGFFSLLKLTVPLTAAVAFIVFLAQSKAIESYFGFWITSALALVGSAWLSQTSGVGKPIDWLKIWSDAVSEYPGPIALFAGVFGMIGAYYQLYGAGPFFLSVFVGFVAGCLLAGKKAR